MSERNGPQVTGVIWGHLDTAAIGSVSVNSLERGVNTAFHAMRPCFGEEVSRDGVLNLLHNAPIVRAPSAASLGFGGIECERCAIS